jgi:beta-galactosidase GanA
MSWPITYLHLGRCSVNRADVQKARRLIVSPDRNKWAATEADCITKYDVSFFKDKLNYLDMIYTVEIAKFIRASYHTDQFHCDTYFIAFVCDDFKFQQKGHPEVLFKKGHAYLFDQRRLHRAHNHGIPFVCAVGAVYRSELPEIMKILNSKKL